MKKFILYLFVFLLLISAAVTSVIYYFNENNKVFPGEVTFFEGASAREVADILEVNGNIKNADVFYYYLRIKETYYEINPFTEKRFKPAFKNGTFDIKTGDFEYLIQFISDFKNEKKQVVKELESSLTVIPEGTNIEGLANILDKNNIVNKEAFLQMANDINFYTDLQKEYLWLPEFDIKKRYNLEGYLHPNSYDFERGTLPHTIIKRMLDETDKFYEENKIAILDQKLSFDEIITLSSIVEKESKFEEDRPKVARVFLNRIKQGMKLQSDITVLYALGEHKTFVTYKDLEVDSPFNTYKVDGLPIGPINSPSLSSIKSVLNPEPASFKHLYFYARPNGETFYSENFDDHEKIRIKYEKEWLELEK